MVKNGKQHQIRLIQENINGFIEVNSTSGLYIINMMYILLNIIEMLGLMCSSFPGIDEYTRIPSVYNIISCISLI